jgi:transposase-like protein
MHKNARLTPKGREVMLARLEAGQHQVDVAQAMGVSLTTVKKWLRRYRAEAPGSDLRWCMARRSVTAPILRSRVQ